MAVPWLGTSAHAHEEPTVLVHEGGQAGPHVAAVRGVGEVPLYAEGAEEEVPAPGVAAAAVMPPWGPCGACSGLSPGRRSS